MCSPSFICPVLAQLDTLSPTDHIALEPEDDIGDILLLYPFDFDDLQTPNPSLRLFYLSSAIWVAITATNNCLCTSTTTCADHHNKQYRSLINKEDETENAHNYPRSAQIACKPDDVSDEEKMFNSRISSGLYAGGEWLTVLCQTVSMPIPVPIPYPPPVLILLFRLSKTNRSHLVHQKHLKTGVVPKTLVLLNSCFSLSST